MSFGIGRRLSSDLAWLWLWCRPVVVALIVPLAWEPPYAMGAALEKDKKKKKKNCGKNKTKIKQPIIKVQLLRTYFLWIS